MAAKESGTLKLALETGRSPLKNRNTNEILRPLDLNTAKITEEQSRKELLSEKPQKKSSKTRKENAENQHDLINLVKPFTSKPLIARNTGGESSEDCNQRKPAVKPRSNRQQHLATDRQACIVVQSHNTNETELTRASTTNILKKPPFMTSTPKKVSTFTPTLNIRSSRTYLPTGSRETLFDKEITNKSGCESANPSTGHTVERSLNVLLDDKVGQGQRRRSKSLCLSRGPYEITRADESPSCFREPKTLKVVLEDIQGKKDKLRSRSNSLCGNIADLIISGNKTQVPSRNALSEHLNETQKAKKSNSHTFIKELVINLPRVNKQKDGGKICGVQQLRCKKVECRKGSNNNNQGTHENPLRVHRLQNKGVTFNLPTKSKHELRKLEPKKYVEESDTESFSADGPVLNLSLKAKNLVPVYRKASAQSSRKGKAITDLYEFTDSSPKKPRQKKQRESSILFDRETYKIVKKIEVCEAKAKKRAVEKASKLRKKSYKNIFSDIIKNAGKKINKKTPAESKGHTLVPVYENELENDVEMIVESPTDLPSRDHRPEPPVSPLALKSSDATIRKHYSALSNSKTTKTGINGPALHRLHSSDNSLSRQDIDSCFGFEEDHGDPPNSNKNLKGGIDSPADFHVKRPNANSTMLQRSSSPWRSNLNVRQVPHFVSIKDNALPRIDQDMVMDHTLVREFGDSSNIEHNRTPRQSSIFDFVHCNVPGKENTLMRGSLYDAEEFDSPDKINRLRRINERANEVRRNLQVSITDEASKIPPAKRAPLMPLNESHHQSTTSDVANSFTYFGFEESSTGPVEQRENRDGNSPGKPSRFSLTNLKRYYRKQKGAKEKESIGALDGTSNEQSGGISVMEGFGDDDANDRPRLFEEPEDMLDKMAMEVRLKKPKKRRRDSETERKKRKHKKTKFELEQEAWINSFNEHCNDIAKERLEVEYIK